MKTIKAAITREVDIQPFDVPVRAYDGDDDNPMVIEFSELDALTLEKLCADFREGVFKRAGKEFPPVDNSYDQVHLTLQNVRDALGKANINHKLSDLRDLILDCKNIIDNTL